MANGYWDWDATTPLNNGSVDATINWVENQPPSTVNNSSRAWMSRAAQQRNDQSYPTAGGTANALTLTPGNVITSYVTGMVFTFRALANNSSATVNLNISGVGNKLVRKIVAGADVALAVGDILDDQRYTVVYDTTANAAAGAWLLVNPSTVSTDTIIVNTAIVPDANDGAALGTAALQWSDLFLASGGVVNFNNGDVTITHSANGLAFAGAANGYSFDDDITIPAGGIVQFGAGDFQITASGGNATMQSGLGPFNLTLNQGGIRGLSISEVGTYTPTITNVTNVAASVAVACLFLRIAQMVFVFGRCTVDPTTVTTATEVGISLPIASNLAIAGDCVGTGAAAASVSEAWGIQADTTNDRASMTTTVASAANHSVSFSFMYQVI